MSYQLPSRNDELWRRTPPEVFSFPQETSPNPVEEFSPGGGHVRGVRIARLRGAFWRLPHVPDRYGEPLSGNDLSRFICDFANDGVFVHVESSTRAEIPVPFLLRLVPGGIATLKSLIIIESGSEVSLVEDIRDPGGSQLFFSTRVIIGEDSNLTYKRMWRWKRNSYAELKVSVAERGRLELVTLYEGSRVAKVEQCLDLEGEGSGVEELFVDLARPKAHFDLSSQVNHLAPRSTSKLEVRGVVWDRAYSLHHGLIRVSKRALESESYFASRHLLMSSRGRADSIPKLEIATDEVRAGHGATISDVDQAVIYYLMTRGIPRRQAEHILVRGFLSPLYESFPEMGGALEEYRAA